MPITVVVQPASGVDVVDPTPVYDFIMCELTSSAPEIVRMRIQLHVHDEDTLGSVIIAEPSATIDPQPDASNEFRFDVQALIRDYVKGYTYGEDSLPTIDSATAWLNKYSSGRIYEIDVTEVIESSSGLLIDGDAEVLLPVLAVNTDSDMAQYLMSADDSGRFLTNHPRSEPILVRRDENLFISGLLANTIEATTNYQFDDPSVTYFLGVEKFDISGASLGVSNLSMGSGTDKARRFDLGVGPVNINAVSAGIISAATITYEVWLHITTPTATVISERMEFKIDDDNVDERNLSRLIWVNDLGGLEYFTFDGELLRSTQTDKEAFQQVLRDDNTSENRGRKTLRTFRNRTVTVHSDILSEDKRRWLQEILDDVLTWEERSGYSAISIVTREMKVVDRIEGVYQLFLEYISSQVKNRQHG